MLRRRDFILASALAPSALNAGSNSPAGGNLPAGPPMRIKLGCQSGPLTEERLEFMRRHSVEAVCGTPDAPRDGRMWETEELLRLKERIERHGLTLDMVALPFLESTHIDRTARPAIMLGRSPERDRDIEDVQRLVRNCSRAGIPAIKYNLNLLGVPRTTPTPGRGGSSLSTFRLSEASGRAALVTSAGRVTEDLYWERITYFLERVIPVAAEFKIRMACHPHDPSVPP